MQVEIKGVVLLNVSLSREVVPGFARIILRTTLKRNLVSLLRAEITQVVNRRAWYDSTKLTTEVTSLYKVRTQCIKAMPMLNKAALCISILCLSAINTSRTMADPFLLQFVTYTSLATYFLQHRFKVYSFNWLKSFTFLERYTSKILYIVIIVTYRLLKNVG